VSDRSKKKKKEKKKKKKKKREHKKTAAQWHPLWWQFLFHKLTSSQQNSLFDRINWEFAFFYFFFPHTNLTHQNPSGHRTARPVTIFHNRKPLIFFRHLYFHTDNVDGRGLTAASEDFKIRRKIPVNTLPGPTSITCAKS
jgi:hypothetical protein